MNAYDPHKPRTLQRWAKFNAVGALGFCVQLLAVYVFIRSLKMDPLVGTALAVETAVLHNFIWHHLLTWKDCRSGRWSDSLLRLLAFNVTNGGVSMAGNLFFAWLIVERQGTSLLGANLLAITVCSLINFVLSDKIVFRISGNRNPTSLSPKMHRGVRLVPPMFFCSRGDQRSLWR
jgi:putative flippase GtrA